MHKRRHKVPWKLVKKETSSSSNNNTSSSCSTQQEVVKKKVFVCPEPSCLHHNPSHALGDLVGIKKHFRRKHSDHKQWVCQKCSKAYAVHSDFKAHLKTCGTRGHSCDCGRVFSRVESFIEHQDACSVGRLGGGDQSHATTIAQPAISSRTASSTSPSSEPNINIVPIPPLLQGFPLTIRPLPPAPTATTATTTTILDELRLLRCSSLDINHESETRLKLSLGSCSNNNHNKSKGKSKSSSSSRNNGVEAVARLKECASEEMKLAMEEKAYGEEARREAKREIEMAEFEFGKAKRLRKEAEEEVHKAEALKKQAMKKISSTLLQITCQACKQQFQSSIVGVYSEETSMVMSDMSSPTTEGEGE
ncbi:protein SHOOT GRAVITROPISM 5 [Senna tora]|uniref:Protein SHOOT GRAVITROPISM 5 n=1 Tax=Senna tora TaxID=362788 RepID=A0A834SRV5_9FABA|nr:protein SHOOT GRAVITROPISM 5 [Senna tora]